MARRLYRVLHICRSRRLKRRHEEEHDDEDHSMFDANQLKEHEEFTKVKNVELIELGRFEMETWYFSPLPEEFRECKVSLQLHSFLHNPSSCRRTDLIFQKLSRLSWEPG